MELRDLGDVGVLASDRYLVAANDAGAIWPSKQGSLSPSACGHSGGTSIPQDRGPTCEEFVSVFADLARRIVLEENCLTGAIEFLSVPSASCETVLIVAPAPDQAQGVYRPEIARPPTSLPADATLVC
jgi:hypothetical protein